ncbi:hypothetical protein JOD66_002592 [Nocardioides nitrophenolicus]|nr:hypothetical protein [Nocardioides nitrophenolicus]
MVLAPARSPPERRLRSVPGAQDRPEGAQERRGRVLRLLESTSPSTPVAAATSAAAARQASPWMPATRVNRPTLTGRGTGDLYSLTIASSALPSSSSPEAKSRATCWLACTRPPTPSSTPTRRPPVCCRPRQPASRYASRPSSRPLRRGGSSRSSTTPAAGPWTWRGCTRRPVAGAVDLSGGGPPVGGCRIGPVQWLVPRSATGPPARRRHDPSGAPTQDPFRNDHRSRGTDRLWMNDTSMSLLTPHVVWPEGHRHQMSRY